MSGVLWRSQSRPPHFQFQNIKGYLCFVGRREVYKVEVYARIRRAVQVDGMSIRQASREFGLLQKSIGSDAVFPAARL